MKKNIYMIWIVLNIYYVSFLFILLILEFTQYKAQEPLKVDY